MASWHDGSVCSRIDLFVSEGLATCLSCGSYRDHPYVYEPIKQRSEIRLLKIHPGEGDDPIRGDLVISSNTSEHEYDAVSYTWADETGDASRRFRAFIGTGYVEITRSCQKALQRIRSRFYTKCVWIDSICVDQDNLQERGHQVDLMPRIYTRAKKTFVYVGPTTTQEEHTLEALATGRVGHGWDADEEPFWVTLNNFLNRPYFFRVWIIQEIALSPNPVILCGEKEFPWSVLHNGTAQRSLPKYLRLWLDERIVSPLLSLGKRRLRSPAELPQLLRLGRKCKATDPRDRVFALLGLVVSADADSLIADYERSTSGTFTWIASYLADIGTAADILGNLNISYDKAGSGHIESQNQLQLPSWVPDWTNAGETFLDRFPAARTYLRTLPLQFDKRDMTALVLRGFEVRPPKNSSDLSLESFGRAMLVRPLEPLPRYVLFQATQEMPKTPHSPLPVTRFIMILHPVMMDKDWEPWEVDGHEDVQGLKTDSDYQHNWHGTFRFLGLLDKKEGHSSDVLQYKPIPYFPTKNAWLNVSIKLV